MTSGEKNIPDKDPGQSESIHSSDQHPDQAQTTIPDQSPDQNRRCCPPEADPTHQPQSNASQSGAETPGPVVPGRVSPEKSPRTGRRRQDSRRRLLDAARILFVERGYHSTRPQDIARAADVGHGTFYLHFPDKRACFFAFVDEACAEVDAMVLASLEPAEGLEERIEAIIEAVIRYHREHPGVLMAALVDPGVIDADTDHTTLLVERWASQWAKDLAERASEGRVFAHYDWDVVGLAIMGMLRQTAASLARSEEGRIRMGRTLKTFIVRAIKP